MFGFYLLRQEDQHDQLDGRLASLADELGGSVVTDARGKPSVVGVDDGQRYVVYSGVGSTYELMITDLDPSLRIGPVWTSHERTGDVAFDRVVGVEGAPWIDGHLDSATRATLIDLVRAGHRLGAGVWTIQENLGGGSGVAIRDALTLAKRWQGPSSSARLALTDPHNDVRVRAMLRLDGAKQTTVARVAAARGGPDVVAALSSPHADEVVAAALLLRDEGGASALVALRAAEARMEGVARDTVREAISAIRARVEDHGALSLVDSEVGGLSRPSEVGGLSRE
jgi:hypothetical protein